MALMLGALYDALRSGNIPEDKATKAAEEVAAYDNRIGGVETRLSVLTALVSTNLALTTAIAVKLFLP
jgi:hypothetical protein